jgi:polyisoprenoid-binding protein YceI
LGAKQATMATYKIDPAHSDITFKVRHLMITNISGDFSRFDATMTSEKEDFTDASVSFEADVNSISTNQEQRDAHLLSDDFFNAEKFPKITFKSTGIEKKSDHEYVLHGDLTIRDITKNVALNVTYNGQITDPYGQQKFGFEITGRISRNELG